MRRFGFERALVSETDILDGLAYEMLDIRIGSSPGCPNPEIVTWRSSLPEGRRSATRNGVAGSEPRHGRDVRSGGPAGRRPAW